MEDEASISNIRSSTAIHRVDPFTLAVLEADVKVAVIRREIPKSASNGVPADEMKILS